MTGPEATALARALHATAIECMACHDYLVILDPRDTPQALDDHRVLCSVWTGSPRR